MEHVKGDHLGWPLALLANIRLMVMPTNFDNVKKIVNAPGPSVITLFLM